MSKKIILTGGGTAGHVTPNLALLPRLRAEGYEIHYIGTAEGIEKSLVDGLEGVTYHTISAGKLRRYFSLKNLTDPFKVVGGIFQAKRIINKVKPDVVFSKGGFVSVPVVIAAKGMAPIVAHESDYTPGLANKITAKFADRVCVTFEDTLKYVGAKGVHTGTPIRPELYGGDRQRGLDFTGFSGEKPILLTMGGSQGAQAHKRRSAIGAAAADPLLRHYPPLRQGQEGCFHSRTGLCPVRVHLKGAARPFRRGGYNTLPCRRQRHIRVSGTCKARPAYTAAPFRLPGRPDTQRRLFCPQGLRHDAGSGRPYAGHPVQQHTRPLRQKAQLYFHHERRLHRGRHR